MKKILLMGNPNVGKSALFSRMTGTQVTISNYPGTTVEFTRGFSRVGEEKVEVIDVPGSYTLEPTSRAEEVAVEMLREGDVVICVLDSTNLERNLYLALQVLERSVPSVVVLNFWDETRHKGIDIDTERLERELGVPVVPTVAISGQGFYDLFRRIKEARPSHHPERSPEDRWVEIGRITQAVQTLHHRHHTFRDWLEEASVKPLTGFPIALFVLLSSFFVIRAIGEGLIGTLIEPIFENLYKPLMMSLSNALASLPFVQRVVVGDLIDGRIDFVQSMGVLTTGLFVPLGMVLPYVIAFYLVLGFLEDFGYLPRLAVLLDNLFHRLGLHGYVIIPALLGFGCNVPGILATRILESSRQRFIACTLISIAVPCAALQAMIIGLLGREGLRYVALVYLVLFLSWVVIGRLLNWILPGFSPPLIVEIPPYRWPPVRVLWKKLRTRVVGFLREAVPIVLGGVLVVNVLYGLGLFERLASFTAPVVTRLLGLPEDTVVAILIGFLRKDVAVGMMASLGLSANQLVIGCVVLAMFFPCIATFIILLKELGLRNLVKATAVMVVSALAAGGLLNLVLS